MSKTKLRQLLSKRLHLDQPQLRFERIGSKLAGSFISATFRGKSDLRRQRMIRDLLDRELGAGSDKEVGTVLAYTPEAWNIELPAEVR